MRASSYADFSLALHRRVSRDRVPVNGTIEVTRRCPLECSHCYNNLPMDDRAAQRGEMSLDEIRRLLDDIAEAGCLWLLFTGGEIFARRDFLDIYAHAKRCGFLVTLFTNGTLITPRIADFLVQWRPFAIEITLYGRTKETYEALTGIPGSYERCMRGIDLLRKRGLPLKLKTVAVTTNRHEVAAMAEFARELGVEFKFDGMINPRIDCSQSPLGVRLSPMQVVEMDLESPERTGEWTRLAREFHGPVHAGSDEVYHCGGGISSFAVDPEGKMSICVLSHMETYDLRRGSFHEGWAGFLRRVRAKKITRLTKCNACAIKSLCSTCPANGELDSGDPEAPVDFFCHVAHLRAHALGYPPLPHGDCDYCPGGRHHAELMREAGALDALRRSPPRFGGGSIRLLPVLEGVSRRGSCRGGGCASCGEGHPAPGEMRVGME